MANRSSPQSLIWFRCSPRHLSNFQHCQTKKSNRQESLKRTITLGKSSDSYLPLRNKWISWPKNQWSLRDNLQLRWLLKKTYLRSSHNVTMAKDSCHRYLVLTGPTEQAFCTRTQVQARYHLQKMEYLHLFIGIQMLLHLLYLAKCSSKFSSSKESNLWHQTKTPRNCL